MKNVIRNASGHAEQGVASGSGLALPAFGRFALLTCMDTRVDPEKLVGARSGDAQIIRNAGGRATEDAIRALVLAYELFGAREWFVVQHSQCGMALLTEELTRDLLGADAHASRSDFRANESGTRFRIPVRDEAQNVSADLTRIRAHALVPREILLHGYVYDVDAERLTRIAPVGEPVPLPPRETARRPSSPR